LPPYACRWNATNACQVLGAITRPGGYILTPLFLPASAYTTSYRACHLGYTIACHLLGCHYTRPMVPGMGLGTLPFLPGISLSCLGPHLCLPPPHNSCLWSAHSHSGAGAPNPPPPHYMPGTLCLHCCHACLAASTYHSALLTAFPYYCITHLTCHMPLCL